MGRPTKYDPAYCEAVVEHCKDGSSIASFAASIDVCRDTVTEWCKQHGDFSLAVKRAKSHCAAWWERIARQNAMGAGNGNATLCIFGLKNMAPEDWRDKVETEHSGKVTTAVEHRIVDNRGDITD